MLNVADLIYSMTNEDSWLGGSSGGSDCSPVFSYAEENDFSICSTGANEETMICNTKKRKRKKKKKKDEDDGPVALEEIFKVAYEPDQWSPRNHGGKKKYGRRFLLRLRFQPVCLEKPDCLLERDDLVEIVLKECLQEQKCHLCTGSPPDSREIPCASGSDPEMKMTETVEMQEQDVYFDVFPKNILSDAAAAVLNGANNCKETAAYIVLDMVKNTEIKTTMKTDAEPTSTTDQWTPENPNGRKKYGRAFLLKRHSHPLCLLKPKTLNNIHITVKTDPFEHMHCHVCELEMDESAFPDIHVFNWNKYIPYLIETYKKEEHLIKSKQISTIKAWSEIAKEMEAVGLFITANGCRSVVSELKGTYQSILSGKDDLKKENWPYFELLDGLFKESPDMKPVPQLESTVHCNPNVLQENKGKYKWSRKDTLLLIQIFKEEEPRILCGQMSEEEGWKKIAKILQGKEVFASSDDCWSRMYSLKKMYEAMLCGGNILVIKSWPYFELLYNMYDERQCKIPALPLPQSSTSCSAENCPNVLQDSEGKYIWSHEDTLLLLQTLKQEFMINGRKISEKDSWKKFFQILLAKGITASVGECQEKLKKLISTYQTALGNGQMQNSWQYFKLLDSIFNEGQCQKPALPLKSDIKPASPQSSACSSTQSCPNLLQNSKGKYIWSHEDILLLIQMFKEEEPKIKSRKISEENAWKEIAQRLLAKGITASVVECQEKMKKLLTTYYTALGNSQMKKSWQYFMLIHSIFNAGQCKKPALPLKTNIKPASPQSSACSSTQSCPDVLQNSKGKFKWNHQRVLHLIQVFKEEEPRMKARQISEEKGWEKIEMKLRAKGVTASVSECRERMNKLIATYEKALLVENAVMKKSWQYFELFHSIFHGNPCKKAALPLESNIQPSLPQSSSCSMSSSQNFPDVLQKNVWSHQDTLLLIQFFKDEEPRIKSREISEKGAWKKIAKMMQAKSVIKSVDECREMMNILTLTYKTALSSKEMRKSWKYFSLLDSIFKEGQSKNSVLPLPSASKPSTSSNSHNCPDVLQCSETRYIWSHQDTLLLIQLYRDEEPRIKAGQISEKKAWKKIAKMMQAKAVATSVSECREMMHKLIQIYETAVSSKKMRKSWPYFELLNSIFKKLPCKNSVLSEPNIQPSVSQPSTSRNSHNSHDALQRCETKYVWRHEDILLLILTSMEVEPMITWGEISEEEGWTNIARILQAQGVFASIDECRGEMLSLKQRYKSILSNASDPMGMNWPYFELLDGIFKERPRVEPVLPLEHNQPFLSQLTPSNSFFTMPELMEFCTGIYHFDDFLIKVLCERSRVYHQPS